jgi:hypothetical protein
VTHERVAGPNPNTAYALSNTVSRRSNVSASNPRHTSIRRPRPNSTTRAPALATLLTSRAAVARQNADLPSNQVDELWSSSCENSLMLRLLRLLFVLIVRSFRSHRELLMENLALRQQLAVWKQRHPQPRISVSDKLFWVMLRRI